MTTLAHSHSLSQEDLSPRTCEDLLHRLRCRETAALAELTRQYGAAITRTAYLQLGDAAAAEDIAQDTLLAAWDGARRTTPRTAIWPWLLGITFNRCRKHWRTLSRRRKREKVAHACRQINVDEAKLERDDQRLADIRNALGALSQVLRIVVVLRYFEGMSVRDTAVALGIPEGTVKRRCHVAIGELREQLNEVTP